MNAKSVKKFQTLYKQEFGEEISYEDALLMANDLVRAIQITYKDINKKDMDHFLQEHPKKL